MTTIGLSVFVNLSGAAPSLLSRALELINNPKLSSLEPLRQALSSGDFIVREVTDADNIPSRAHASFVDPKTDPITGAILAPGTVLLRKENLTSASDASVLQFVDDIFHEGRGHGSPNQVAGRSGAASDLSLNSNGFSTTERGDRYVNSWIDDETISRYTAFTFRQELATLSTEYTASNRAVLQTDETYRAFTRLSAVADEMGLTGDDKKAYIVEMARPVVSAYRGSSRSGL